MNFVPWFRVESDGEVGGSAQVLQLFRQTEIDTHVREDKMPQKLSEHPKGLACFHNRGIVVMLEGRKCPDIF